jgi:hypothetical protein
MLSIDQPITEVMIIPYKGAKYCGGIAGGSGLKLAMKVPYSLTVKLSDGLLTGIVALGFDGRVSTQVSLRKVFVRSYRVFTQEDCLHHYIHFHTQCNILGYD